MDLVGVASVVHGQVAEHAVEADVGQVGGFLGSCLCLCLELGMLVDVWHGRYGAAAGPYARKSTDGRRARRRRRFCDEGRSPCMEGARRRGWCSGGGGVAAAKCSRSWVRAGGRVGAGRGRLRVEQDRLGHGGRLILGNDDAAVAGVVEVDLRQRPVVAAAGRQGGGVQRVGLAVGVVERVGFGIQQVSRVAFLGGRVEDRGRGGVRRVCALAAAEEVSDHGGQRAHSSMEACSWP